MEDIKIPLPGYADGDCLEISREEDCILLSVRYDMDHASVDLTEVQAIKLRDALNKLLGVKP
jgi:hypothetical protein